MGFNTNTEKIAFLEALVVSLHKNIYYCCLIFGIDVETLDLSNFDPVGFVSSHLDNASRSERLQWGATNTIVRDMEKLKIVNKKLDELKNA
jgi:hypothetical protein